jgi:hypothetical protein
VKSKLPRDSIRRGWLCRGEGPADPEARETSAAETTERPGAREGPEASQSLEDEEPSEPPDRRCDMIRGCFEEFQWLSRC